MSLKKTTVDIFDFIILSAIKSIAKINSDALFLRQNIREGGEHDYPGKNQIS
jgi:hypothetical protein